MPQKITKALLALEAEQSTIIISFADDINGLAREEEVAKEVECLDKASTAYVMKINAKK